MQPRRQTIDHDGDSDLTWASLSQEANTRDPCKLDSVQNFLHFPVPRSAIGRDIDATSGTVSKVAADLAGQFIGVDLVIVIVNLSIPHQEDANGVASIGAG